MSKARLIEPMLTRTELERLTADPSLAARTETAARVGAEISKRSLTEKERRIAVEIFALLARDVERQVREALSEHIKRCSFLPRKIARDLADDVESVALPIIEFSKVLTDDDLIRIVRTGNAAKQMGVAKREVVTVAVADVLVDTRNEEVVTALLSNPRAELSEELHHKVLDTLGSISAIQALLIGRPTLPLTVTDRLIRYVSTELREHLVSRHDFPRELADELSMHGQERALTRVLASERQVDEVERLVASLHADRKLTPTLLLRALCEGDIHFFEASMAKMVGIPIENARTLIFDRGPGGLKQICEKSGLPRALIRAFQIAVDVVREARVEHPNTWRIGHTRRIIHRLTMEYREVCPEDLEHVLSQLSRRVVG